MDDKERYMVWQLRFEKGMSYEEIADRVRLDVSQVWAIVREMERMTYK